MKGWVKTLGKDALVYGIGFGVSKFLQVIILPIIAQALTLSEFGFYSNYVIFYTFAGGLFIFGLDSSVTRFFFDSDNKKYHQQIFSSAYFFILTLSVLSTTLFFIFPSAILQLLGIPENYEPSLKYVLLCIPLVTLNGFLLTWFKWKREQIKFLVNSAGNVVFLLIPLLLVNKVSFNFIFQVIFGSQLLIAIVSTVLARNYLRFYFHPRLMRSLLAYGLPWMLVFLFGASRTYLDRMFLTGYLNADAYGLYNFSIRIASLLSLVITAFDMSFGPVAYSIWHKEEAPAFFARLHSLYTFLIAAFACLICIFSPALIQLFGGSKFAGSEKILPLLLFAAIPLSLINFSNIGSVYAKKSIITTISLFCGLVVVLTLNLLFTRHYLQYGAAASSLIGHLVIIITGYIFSARYYRIPFAYLKDAATFLFFLLLSFISVNLHINSNMYLEILIKSGVFAIGMIFFILIAFKEEYKKALSTFRTWRG